MKCKCRQCSKSYNEHTSRAEFTGYCSQSCMKNMAESLGWRERNEKEVRLYDVLKKAGQIGSISALNKLEKAIKNFETTMDKYRKFGASDTEPRYQFELIQSAANLGEPFPDTSGRWWVLYWCSMDCSEAANALTLAAKKVYDEIKKERNTDDKI